MSANLGPSFSAGGPAKERGLAALNDARRTRRRAIVFGRVRLREVATKFWLFTFAGIVIFGVVYYRYAQGELASKRNKLAARQRAVAVAAGDAGFALRDKLEKWALGLATGPLENHVAQGASLEEISHGPVVHLRARLTEARDVESLRRAASISLRDGFTSCLFVGRANEPASGAPCKSKNQCGPGELCDDWGVCSAPGHPYNLRLLYDSLDVLGPDWDARLSSTGDELQVRAMELELEDTSKHEIPAAAELIRRSRFFSVALDEEVSSAAPLPPVDAGAPETADQRLQASEHFVRVGIWDIARGEPLLTLRVLASGELVALGQRASGNVMAARARQRQANNCAVAVEVREALLAASGASAPRELP
jgi:hypothetical protein